MSRILVIEDNEDLAYGLCSNLELEGYEVAVAATGRDGLQRARSWQPDLVLLDLMLPEMDGFAVLEALREGADNTRVLILTARGEEVDKVRGLRSGADDYVTKPFGLMELLARVEALLRRPSANEAAATPGDGRLRTLGDIEINADTRSVTRAGESIELAPKEFDLLLELLDKDGAVCTRADLLRRVWGHASRVATRTVDTHIAELRRKLERDPSRPAYILTVRKVGYRIAVPECEP